MDEIYKLALLSPKEQQDFVAGMKLLPGHGKWFRDMFEFVSTIYSWEDAKEEIISKTMQNWKMKQDEGAFKRATSAKTKPIHNRGKKKQRSLLKQYESLDIVTRDNFNKKFIT